MAKVSFVSGRTESEIEYARMLSLEIGDCGVETSDGIEPDSLLVIAVFDVLSPDVCSEIAALSGGLPTIVCYTEAEGEYDVGFILVKRPVNIRRLSEYVVSAVGGKVLPARVQSGIALIPERTSVALGSRTVRLSKTEYALASCLISRRGETVTREELKTAVWGDGSPDSNKVEVYVNYLRKKLDTALDRKIILTVRGKGYTIK